MKSTNAACPCAFRDGGSAITAPLGNTANAATTFVILAGVGIDGEQDMLGQKTAPCPKCRGYNVERQWCDHCKTTGDGSS